MVQVTAVLWPLAFASEDLGPYVLVIGLILVSGALLMGIRKKRMKQKREPDQQDQLERRRRQNAMRGDLDQTMVELEQLAKRLGSQLDAKTLTIEKRLAEADQRIAELHRLEQARGENHGPSSPTATRDENRMDHGMTPGQPQNTKPSQTQTRAQTQPDTQSAQQAEQPEPTDQTTREIYRLADEGSSPGQIAQRVNEHVGKVELILALRDT